MSDLHDRARALLARRDKAPLTFSDSWEQADEWADTIADLLAENERLATMLRWETAGRIHDRYRAEAAEAAIENLGVTPEQAAEGLARFKAREARIAELEARLLALCEAEPVAIVDREAVGRVFWLSIIPDGTQLIPRPSMEGKP